LVYSVKLSVGMTSCCVVGGMLWDFVRDDDTGCRNKAVSMNMLLWTWTLVSYGAVELLSPSSGCSECDVHTIVPDYTASLPRIYCLKNVKWHVRICGRLLKW
jgi:hypothetical protein